VAHTEPAEKLVAAHANILAMDKDGMNALHYAAQESAQHLDILFKGGFKVVDARSNAGLTPLHVAAVTGTASAVRWLLDHGANVNAVTAADYDYLPRHLAPGRPGLFLPPLRQRRHDDQVERGLELATERRPDVGERPVSRRRHRACRLVSEGSQRPGARKSNLSSCRLG